MLRAILAFVAFQLLGDLIAALASLPIPGPVLGMIFFLAYLALSKGPAPFVIDGSQGILRYLGLLFVPAGVGIVQFGALIAAEWPAMIAALFVSTVAAILLTAWTAAATSDDTAAEQS